MSGWTFDVRAIRKQFPALRRRVDGRLPVYLDNACTVLKPRCVAERMRDFYLTGGGCGGRRSMHLLSQRTEALVAQARRDVAEFLGAESPNEIIFTSGTTEAANLVARAFPYEGRRREIVVTDLEHNSFLLPFHEASRRGKAVLRVCRTRDGRIDLGELERLVSDRTALVAMTRSSNVFGGVQPAAEAARIAHRRGACLMLDDAQYLSSHREDVSASKADFVAFSAHKIGGPFGIGVLYGREQLLNRMRPCKVGGGTVRSVQWARGKVKPMYLDAPDRFEAGVQNFGGIVGLAEAIRFLGRIPPAALRAHVGGLVRRAAAGLQRRPQVRVLGSPKNLAEGSIVSFVPAHPDFSPVDFNLYLNHELRGRFIAVRVGEHCAHLLHRSLGLDSTVRLSFFAYNIPEEVDFFLDALDGYLKAACRG